MNNENITGPLIAGIVTTGLGILTGSLVESFAAVAAGGLMGFAAAALVWGMQKRAFAEEKKQAADTVSTRHDGPYYRQINTTKASADLTIISALVAAGIGAFIMMAPMIAPEFLAENMFGLFMGMGGVSLASGLFGGITALQAKDLEPNYY